MTFEQQLRSSLKFLEAYPDEVEELAIQMHLISKAIEEEAIKHSLPYVGGTHVIDRP